MAVVAGQALAAAHELQEERAQAVAWTAGEGRGGEEGQAGRGGEPAPTGRGDRVDRALAAVDLVHLLAELLDNAAAAGDGDGHLIEVADRGFGMTDKELAWANRRLAGDSATNPAGLAAGDRLGLLIVAHLAARNGFGVRLDRSPAGGVTAAVRLPAELLPARARPR